MTGSYVKFWIPCRQALLIVDICIFLAEVNRIPRDSHWPLLTLVQSHPVECEQMLWLCCVIWQREVILVRPESFKSRKLSPADCREKVREIHSCWPGRSRYNHVMNCPWGPHAANARQLLGAESCPWPIIYMTSITQPQGNKFCQTWMSSEVDFSSVPPDRQSAQLTPWF